MTQMANVLDPATIQDGNSIVDNHILASMRAAAAQQSPPVPFDWSTVPPPGQLPSQGQLAAALQARGQQPFDPNASQPMPDPDAMAAALQAKQQNPGWWPSQPPAAIGPDHPDNATLAAQQATQGVSANPFAGRSSLPDPAALQAALQAQAQQGRSYDPSSVPQQPPVTPAGLQALLARIQAIGANAPRPGQSPVSAPSAPPPMPTGNLLPGQANAPVQVNPIAPGQATAAITPGGIPLALGPNTTLGGNWGGGGPLPAAPPSGPPPQPAGQVRDGSWVPDAATAATDPQALANQQIAFIKAARQVPGLGIIGDENPSSPNAGAAAPMNPQGVPGSPLGNPVSQFGAMGIGAAPTQLGPDPLALEQALKAGKISDYHSGLPNAMTPAEQSALNAWGKRNDADKLAAAQSQAIIQARALAESDARKSRMVGPGYDEALDRNQTNAALQQMGPGGGVPAQLARTNPALFEALSRQQNAQGQLGVAHDKIAAEKLASQAIIGHQQAQDAQQRMQMWQQRYATFRQANPTLPEDTARKAFNSLDPMPDQPVQGGQAAQGGQPNAAGQAWAGGAQPQPGTPQPGASGQGGPQQPSGSPQLQPPGMAPGQAPPLPSSPMAQADLQNRLAAIHDPEQAIETISNHPAFRTDPAAVRGALNAMPSISKNDLDNYEKKYDTNIRLGDIVNPFRVPLAAGTVHEYRQKLVNARRLREIMGWPAANVSSGQAPRLLPPI